MKLSQPSHVQFGKVLLYDYNDLSSSCTSFPIACHAQFPK